ncbi:MAG TPA: hypothetical protein VKW04_07570 [Planctomycetota bacterium]|nr:hypothetical protein [Planctomycetota bacterium]
MNGLWAALPGAALSGLGAVLCATGYRQVRFQPRTVGVGAFAAAGAAIGALLGFPAFAAGLCATGALLATLLHGKFLPVAIGVAAAMGGGILGLLLALLSRHSSPIVLSGATAIGAAVIALLDTRLMTMGWTATTGAAVVTQGIFRAIPALAALPRTQLTVTLAVIFVLLAGGGFAFQLRTTPEEHPTTLLAPAPAASASA